MVWFLVRSLLLACRWLPSPCASMWTILCVHQGKKKVSVVFSSSREDTSPIRLWLYAYASFNLNYLLRGRISADSHIAGSGLQHIFQALSFVSVEIMPLHNSLIFLKLSFSICEVWLLGECNEVTYT